MSFLHGVKIIQLKTQGGAVNFPSSSIICLVGVAPVGPLQQLIQCLNPGDDAQFGAITPGNTIANALDSIRASGNCPVFVVNIYTTGTHDTNVVAEVVVVAGGKFKLAFPPNGSLAVLKDTTNTTTYVAGTDYTLDAFGNGVVISTAIIDGNIHGTYAYLDDSKVNSVAVIGTDTGGANKTGLQLFKLLYTSFGVKPKIIICPGFSQLPAVSQAMAAIAIFGRGVYGIDDPAATTVANAITGRSPSGTFGWNISDKRSMLLFNRFKKGNPDPAAAAGSTIYDWYSSFMAGVIANMDNTDGYFNSPSNRSIPALAAEIPITCSLTDNSFENQLLNAAGIICYYVLFGTGLKTFGNRSAAYPASASDPMTFIMVQRITDVLDDTTEQLMIPLLDGGLTSSFITKIVEDNNTIIRTLIGKGALIVGSNCVANPSDNPPNQLAAGQLTLARNYATTVPMETLTIKSTYDITLLANLFPGN